MELLVLVIADGRINEVEEVKRLVRELSQRHGLPVAFIALDNEENSLLEANAPARPPRPSERRPDGSGAEPPPGPRGRWRELGEGGGGGGGGAG